MRTLPIGPTIAAALAACGSQPAAEPASAPPAPSGGIIDPNTPVQVSKMPRPAWAPDYPGSPPRNPPVAIVTNGTADATFEFSTADAPDKVIAFYRGKAEAAGLGSAQASNVAAGTIVYVATGPDSQRLSVAVTPDGGLNHVMVSWAMPEK